jgi:hypothetical protein
MVFDDLNEFLCTAQVGKSATHSTFRTGGLERAGGEAGSDRRGQGRDMNGEPTGRIPQPDLRTIWSIAWPMMLAYCSVPLMGFAGWR